MSLYLITGKGCSYENRLILEQVGGVLHAIGLPWICCGDWQMDPDALSEYDWPNRMGGTIFAGDGTPSHYGNSNSLIDFFVIDNQLRGAVKSCYVDAESGATRPHRPVFLEMEIGLVPEPINKIRAPARLPNFWPIGCRPRPPDWSEVSRDLEDVPEGGVHDLTMAFAKFIALAEQEVADLHGICKDQKPQFFGREEGYHYAEVHDWHRRGHQPAARGEAQMWRRIAAKITMMLHVRQLADSGGKWYRSEETRIANKLRKMACPYTVKPRLWGWWRYFARRIQSESTDILWHAVEVMSKEASSIEASEASTRHRKWHRWASVDAMANGASQGHKWTKGPTPWAPAQAGTDGIQSKQDIADGAALP